jgi:hypothetical protein
MNDTRTFTISYTILISGGTTIDYGKYILLANRGPDIDYASVDAVSSSDLVTFTTFSGGNANKIETSNYWCPPYFCITGGSGAGQAFYQRNPYEFIWRPYSSGLPSQDITVVRMDDRI